MMRVANPKNSGAYIDGQHMFNMSIPDPEGSPPWKHTFKLNQPTNSEFIFALYDSTGFKGANVLPVQSKSDMRLVHILPLLTEQRFNRAMTRAVSASE